MNFYTLIYKNLFRRPIRSALTLAGIATGIGAVVALVGMASGFEAGWTKAYEARGTDVVVARMASSLMPQPFDETVKKEIDAMPLVAQSANLLTELTGVEEAEMIVLSGREWDSFLWDSLKIQEGRKPSSKEAKEVVLGNVAAEVLEKKVGDKVQIDLDQFDVVGIAEGGAAMENSAIMISLDQLQRLYDQKGKVSLINVRLKKGFTDEEMAAFCKTVEGKHEGFRASSISDVLRNNSGIKAAKAMSWGTSILAVVVGVIGVMNTMLMSVFERTREIGILKAIGWSRSRIIRLILFESMALGFLGGIVGIIFGVVGLKILQTMPSIKGRLEPDVSPSLYLLAVVLAVVVGVVSGIYPAIRSSQLNPIAAIRQE